MPSARRSGWARGRSHLTRLPASSDRPASCRRGSSRMPAKELVEYVAKSLVDQPDEVTVEEVHDRDGVVLELHVAEDDMGKGRGGKGGAARPPRTLRRARPPRGGEPVSLEIV